MKKVLIGFLIVLFVLFTLRTIRLRQLGKEAYLLEKKFDLLNDSIQVRINSDVRDFKNDTAMISRSRNIIKQLDTLEKKINFWNLKM
jgi:hypothetical protein